MRRREPERWSESMKTSLSEGQTLFKVRLCPTGYQPASNLLSYILLSGDTFSWSPKQTDHLQGLKVPSALNWKWSSAVFQETRPLFLVNFVLMQTDAPAVPRHFKGGSHLGLGDVLREKWHSADIFLCCLYCHFRILLGHRRVSKTTDVETQIISCNSPRQNRTRSKQNRNKMKNTLYLKEAWTSVCSHLGYKKSEAD